MSNTALQPTFFNRPADIVARELIGKTLCVRRESGDITRLTITETEAYMGPHDAACHAARGRTQRTEPMFNAAGTIYVYLVYGMHNMLNIVTGERDYPAAVLIRGAGEYDGPGKLTKALDITRAANNVPLGADAGIWIEDTPVVPTSDIHTTPRIGIDYAGEWAAEPLRFVWTSSKN